MAVSSCDRMSGAEVDVVEFDGIGAVFFYAGLGPVGWDLLALVVGHSCFTSLMAAMASVDLLCYHSTGPT